VPEYSEETVSKAALGQLERLNRRGKPLDLFVRQAGLPESRERSFDPSDRMFQFGSICDRVPLAAAVARRLHIA
jgi:hypothetical protein